MSFCSKQRRPAILSGNVGKQQGKMNKELILVEAQRQQYGTHKCQWERRSQTCAWLLQHAVTVMHISESRPHSSSWRLLLLRFMRGDDLRQIGLVRDIQMCTPSQLAVHVGKHQNNMQVEPSESPCAMLLGAWAIIGMQRRLILIMP